jgi:pyruvate dehydrogenase E2 component (dihydrolipoamide acetyltransferase)
MSEGKVNEWLKPLGSAVAAGNPLLEVETDKITNVVEASDSGILRRVIGDAGQTYPVQALLGVLAEADVPDSEIDAFVAGYIAPVVSSDSESQEAPQDQFVELPIGKIRYARSGSGEKRVVLIHGFGGDLVNWLFNIDALAEVATVYALDLPGHGRSVKTLGAPTVEWLSQAVLGFMDQAGVASAHLVGHSLGGAIAIRAALDAPERVQSLALIAPAGFGPEINREFLRGFVSATKARELKGVLASLVNNPQLLTRQMVEDLLKYKRIDGVNEALGAIAKTLEDGRELQVLRESAQRALRKPSLILWGQQDQILPVSQATALGDLARVEIIDQAGHVVQMEAAPRVNALLKEHLGAAK